MNPEEVLKIGEGHELDQIRVVNITNKDYTTYWGKEPFTIQAGKERIMLRYIALKFARELADRLITAEADKLEGREKGNVIRYMHKKPAYLNSILVEVVDRYSSKPTNTQVDTGEQDTFTALDVGDISVLEELGIARVPVKSTVDDISDNFRAKTKEEIGDITTPDEQFNHSERDEVVSLVGRPIQEDSPVALIKKAMALGIDIPDGASVDEVKSLIKENLGL
jgi:hypothetical protein